jgi:DNA-3-methyladenine glycosylase II
VPDGDKRRRQSRAGAEVPPGVRRQSQDPEGAVSGLVYRRRVEIPEPSSSASSGQVPTAGVSAPALTDESLAAAVRELASQDPDLAAIVERIGHPPMWDRPPGFGTLVHIVLEQQVSLASAQAAFERLAAAVDPLAPAGFLALDDGELLAIGFSRQKAGYVRGLARALDSGALDLDRFESLPDDEAHRLLVEVKGIGPWTASIYQLMVLRRPDIWPVADIALATSVAEAKGLAARPNAAQMEAIGSAWRPWRSVAARLFWHDYLKRRGR